VYGGRTIGTIRRHHHGGVVGPNLSAFSVYDTFTRANNNTVPGTGEKGGAWSIISGQWGIVSNTLQCTNAADGSLVSNGTLTTGFVQVDITSSDWVTHSPGLFIRGTDANNYIRWICQSGNSGMTSVIAGVPTTLGGGGTTPANGAVCTLLITQTGNAVVVKMNGVTAFSTTLTGGEAAMAGTLTGCRFGGGLQTGGVFDNYQVSP
jgi:hypothetical protein